VAAAKANGLEANFIWFCILKYDFARDVAMIGSVWRVRKRSLQRRLGDDARRTEEQVVLPIKTSIGRKGITAKGFSASRSPYIAYRPEVATAIPDEGKFPIAKSSRCASKRVCFQQVD
jgi:hypothetical protein